MRTSCGVVPRPNTVKHAKIAEDLGYHRARLYDSPALWQDIQVGRSPTIPWFGLLRNTRVPVLDAHNFPNRRLSVLEGFDVVLVSDESAD